MVTLLPLVEDITRGRRKRFLCLPLIHARPGTEQKPCFTNDRRIRWKPQRSGMLWICEAYDEERKGWRGIWATCSLTTWGFWRVWFSWRWWWWGHLWKRIGCVDGKETSGTYWKKWVRGWALVRRPYWHFDRIGPVCACLYLQLRFVFSF